MISKIAVNPPGVSFISTPMISVILTRKLFSSRASFPLSGLSTTSLRIPNSEVSAMHMALILTSATVSTSSGFDKLPILFCKNMDNCLIFIVSPSVSFFYQLLFLLFLQILEVFLALLE